jgi:hypothetical protein
LVEGGEWRKIIKRRKKTKKKRRKEKMKKRKMRRKMKRRMRKKMMKRQTEKAGGEMGVENDFYQLWVKEDEIVVSKKKMAREKRAA